MIKKIFLITLLILTSCTSHITDVTAISTRNINPNEMDLNKLPTVKQVEGSNTVVTTLFTFWRSCDLSKAVEEALEKGDGDLMINSEVTVTSYFIVIGFINTIKIKGDVVNTMGEEKK